MTHDLVIANGTVVTPELGAFEADVAADGDGSPRSRVRGLSPATA